MTQSEIHDILHNQVASQVWNKMQIRVYNPLVCVIPQQVPAGRLGAIRDKVRLPVSQQRVRTQLHAYFRGPR